MLKSYEVVYMNVRHEHGRLAGWRGQEGGLVVVKPLNYNEQYFPRVLVVEKGSILVTVPSLVMFCLLQRDVQTILNNLLLTLQCA